MDEWAKTLVGTLAGFTAGLLAEPAKFWIGAALRKRHLRLALYRDLGLARATLRRQPNLLDESPTATVTWPSVEIYRYYHDFEKPIFYRLLETEAHAIDFVHAHIMRGAASQDQGLARSNVEAALTAFDTCIRDGSLDGRLLVRLERAHEAAWGTSRRRFEQSFRPGKARPFRRLLAALRRR